MIPKHEKRGDAARWYAKHYGWSVFPCHSIDAEGRCTCGVSDCHSPGKHPRVPRGFLDATKDDTIIKAWWDRWPDANPAVATGAPSGFFVIDIDPAHGGDDSFETLKSLGPWPDTVQALTGGGGRHFLFEMSEGISVPSKVGVLPGIDVRGDGGYIVVAPAGHRSGRSYEWEASSRPGEVKIAAPHAQLLDVILGRNGHGSKAGPAPVLPEKIREGERNKWLASFAGTLKRRGCTEAEILAGLKGINTPERFDPPVDDDELAKIAKSISRYPSAPSEAPRSGAAQTSRSLTVINVQDFLAKRLLPREFVLEPILKVKDLAMLHGWRGGGKTWNSIGMACAIASGGTFLRWTARTPRPVLLVDGEMQAEDLQNRIAAILAASDKQPAPDFLRLITPDLQEDGLPNLATPEGQAIVERLLSPGDVLILDNLSTLANGGPENDPESWDSMQGWLLRLRRRGITVIVVHHSGKGGKQRGTSKREDVLDLVLCVKHPADYSPREGARFQVSFEKSRGLKGEAVAAFEATPIPATDGSMQWTTKDIEDAWRQEAQDLKDQGLSLREIAEIVGKDKSTVSRALRAAKGGK